MPWCYWGAGSFGLWWILPVIFFGFMLIMLVMMAMCFRRMMGKGGCGMFTGMHHREDEALSILRQRFAKGEITAEEYAEMRAVLNRQD